uniref:4-hydroxybenzoate polyprenyltransferase, mitochondrial n=1 Tax=Meloidogyne incognita TaxID=6306 RepID=A0A914KK93_MELIC
MRADKPIGTWLLYWPGAWSIALSASPGCLPDAYLLGLFGVGSFLMRSSGCILNDLWDQDIDKKVARTKSRPLANGELTEKEAVILLGGLLSASLAVLLQLNSLSIILGASSLWLVVVYPLAKRFTNWPQLVLGATFNWGALLGCTAVTGKFVPEICIPLYLACICWTMIYDTIYAFQDKKEDILIGLGSTAITFDKNREAWLNFFGLTMMLNLLYSGYMQELPWPFFVSLLVSSSHLIWQIKTLKIDNNSDCLKKFNSNKFIGITILIGIILSNLIKNKEEVVMEEQDDEEEENYGINKRNMNINFYC